ncbi:MAG: alpha/beta fold hydrolase [Sphingomonadaceae bacterium]
MSPPRQARGGWGDGYWRSKDGLELHYRDYPGPAHKPPILCIPGLTRNARDFEGVAERLAGDWRLLCVSLRGRGESGHAKDALSYVPQSYVEDLEALIEELKLGPFVVFGTSLGGLLAMLLSAAGPDRIAGALLNDIGPEIEEAGLVRIRSYVGRSQSWPSWVHAARDIAALFGEAYPDYRLEDWLVMAKRLARLTPGGRIVLDYDMKIAEPFAVSAAPADLDMWPAFESLSGTPLVVVRGELSDILSERTLAEMRRRVPSLEAVTVPDVGHAPTLEEPAAAAAIDRLLARVGR